MPIFAEDAPGKNSSRFLFTHQKALCSEIKNTGYTDKNRRFYFCVHFFSGG